MGEFAKNEKLIYYTHNTTWIQNISTKEKQ